MEAPDQKELFKHQAGITKQGRNFKNLEASLLQTSLATCTVHDNGKVNPISHGGGYNGPTGLENPFISIFNIINIS